MILLIADFTYNWFDLKMTLLTTVNKKLASLMAGKEAELSLIISKAVISIVVIWYYL